MENPLSATQGEVDPETCDQLLKYMALNICWPERILNRGLQNIRWLSKFFTAKLTGSFGAGQPLAYFKFLKIILNKKREKAARERESSPPVFERCCFGNERYPVPGRAGSRQGWGKPVRGVTPWQGASLHPPPVPDAWPALGGSLWRCLPAACFGQEGGSWQLAPCPGIVLGLNGRQTGFFPGIGNTSPLPCCRGAGVGWVPPSLPQLGGSWGCWGTRRSLADGGGGTVVAVLGGCRSLLPGWEQAGGPRGGGEGGCPPPRQGANGKWGQAGGRLSGTVPQGC